VSVTPKPLVSLVTPVYNGSEYLRECIDSVLAQTYQNWRYVIVNNCSADDTLQIAREYAARDARITVSDNAQFLPIVHNHNHALSLIDAESLYCKPLMADDWLYPECLEQLVACALARPSVGLVCASALTGTQRVLFDRLPAAPGATCTYLSGREAGRTGLLREGYFFGSPTTMLIRSDLIRKRAPFYNPDNLQADEEACYDILRESDFAFVHKVLAYVRTHARSYTSATYYLFTMPSCHTYALARYGHEYLSDAEFAQRMDERLHEYYQRLALGAVEHRGEEFWSYHRQMLQMIGAPLDRVKLAGAIGAHVVRKLLSPSALARVIGGRLASATRRVSGR
jgi:glycosyltransferase involved in cell wall biosynthesis